ncbi:MAG: TetR/AcrR family transcriptional regulator [Chloroflexota bacterium]
MKTEKRIQEAAIRVIFRQGYNKTTMQDIANEAGLARSTIYTKWKTKEALFGELIWSESIAYVDTWLELVKRDPDGGTLQGLYRNALLAIRQFPFIRAIYAQNKFVLGNFINDPTVAQVTSSMLVSNTQWLKSLQTNGLIRADLDAEILSWIEVIFRQGLFTFPINLDTHPTMDYERLLEYFASMFEQFAGVQADVDPDAGKIALKNYINIFKREYQQNLND